MSQALIKTTPLRHHRNKSQTRYCTITDRGYWAARAPQRWIPKQNPWPRQALLKVL